MSVKFEALLTNDSSGVLWNTCLWDPNTGSTLKSYRGCTSAPHTTAILGDSYLVSGQPQKPILNVWHINRTEQRPVKQTTPGVVKALAASPDGRFIVMGICEKVHLYQTSTGKLLISIGRHYQEITQLQFTDDGSHFISCGEDGNTFVWSILGAFLANKMPGETSDAQSKPLYHWSDHGLGITGLAVGPGGLRGRVLTVSKDQTCKIYSLSSGDLLLDVTFSTPLTAVAMDLSENNVFVGSNSGPIYTFSLSSPPRDLKLTLDGEKKTNMMVGHTQEVTCLSVSADAQVVASGSRDFDVRLWHIQSRQCVRIISHKGQVSTVRFVLLSASVFDASNPNLAFAQFEKTTFQYSSLMDDNFVLHVHNPDDDADDHIFGRHKPEVQSVSRVMPTSTKSHCDSNPEELAKLKEANLMLYQFAMNKILKK